MKRILSLPYSNALAVAWLACTASLNAAVPAAISDAVSESGDYELIYEIALPDLGPGWANDVPYDVDNTATGPEFDRVAYVMELDDEWVWVSFTAITNALDEIGVPTIGVHETPVQQLLKDMNVFSNIADAGRIQTGEGFAGGNIEFWGGNYAQANAKEIPNASADTFDFGDTLVGGGHGCMQLHNHEASQVLFAYNNWGTNNPDTPGGLGIGNNPNGDPDWTFAGTSADYDKRNLYVLVRAGTAPVLGAPSLVGANASLDGTKIALRFSEPLAASSATLANFSIAGLDITAASLSADDTIILTTAPQTAGTTYAVSYTGISNLQGITTTEAAMEEVTAPATPAILADIPGTAGYDLIYQVAIPDTASWNAAEVPYSVNESPFQSETFDRVAYVVELDGDWVFVSFDAVLDDLGAIGVPTVNAVDQPVQTRVNNLDVDSNTDLVTKGTGLAGGNIEFWPGNYSQPNVKTIPIPNADEGTFDFGDNAGGGAGYGSMQVHNHLASETVFGYNAWGAGGGDLGIGNGGDNPDWTFAGNAASYGTKNLYVLAQSGPTPDLTVENPVALNSVSSSDLARVYVQFDQPMDETTALDSANYTIEGISVTGVSFVDAAQDSVILTTSEMAPATDYTVAISTAILENGPGTQAVMDGSTATYTTLEPLPGFLGAVPETSGMSLAYRLEITETATYGATGVPYSVNESVFGSQDFDRVGYALALDDEWVFVSFDAPRTDITNIGVPTVAVGVTQENVSNLSVVTNVGSDRITQGVFLEGNVEFWGTNYGTANAKEVPNADGAVYDFGDQVVGDGTYGSMQVHNHEASEVLFAFNRWNANDALDIGIGSDTEGAQLDWTFSQNSANFEKRELFIFVGKGEDPNLTVRPTFDSGVVEADGGAQTLSIPVRNTGGETALTLSSVVLNQAGSAYTLVSSPDSIPPGETGNIEVTLDPSTVQGLGTAELVVTSNDPSDPVFTIGLSVSVPLSADLAAWYPLDDDLRDASGNGRHASAKGDVTTGATGLASGNGVQLSPGDQAAFVVTPDIPASQTVSVSLWVQANGAFPSEIGTLFSKVNGDDGESPYGLAVFAGLDNTLGWLTDEDPAGLALSVPNSPLTEPTHVVLVHEDANGADAGATVTRLYLNGVEAAAMEDSLGFTDIEATFQIGARLSESGFNGLIDDVQIYTTALTADAVTQLFENPGSAIGGVTQEGGGGDGPRAAAIASSSGPLTEATLVDFGDLSGGDASFEFAFNVIKGGPSTALAGNDAWALKLEQWNETGFVGTTEFGVVDNTSEAPAIFDADAHVVFVSDTAAAETRIYVNGALAGSVPGNPVISGPGAVFGARDGTTDPAGEGSVLHGWATYNTALSDADIATLASTPFGGGGDALYAQDFEAANDTTDLGDGSIITSNDGTNSVQGGVLRMTQAGTNSTAASFLTPAFDASGGWTATFDFTIEHSGDNTPADGFSFNYGAIPGPDNFGDPAEEGYGAATPHVSYQVDTWLWDDAAGQDAGVGIEVTGTEVALTKAADDDANFKPNERVSASATLSWDPANGASFSTTGLRTNADFVNVATPGFTAEAGHGFSFVARTGGHNETLEIDNLVITAGVSEGPSDIDGLIGYWPEEYVSTSSVHLDLGTLPALTVDSGFTWSFWVNSEETDNNNIVFGNRYMPDGTDFAPREFIKFTPKVFEWHFDGGGENVGGEPTWLPIGVWSHNLVVKDGSTVTYYRDGAEIATGEITGSPVNPQPLYLGGQPGADGNTTEGFAGTFMEVAVFDRALSVDDVADVYDRGLNGVSLGEVPVTPGGSPVDVGFGANGAFGFTLPDGVTADIEYSTDLINWEVIATGVSGAVEDGDAGRSAAPAGYYRAQ